MSENEFPVAEVTPRVKWTERASKMWIVTLVCVLVAIGLVVHSLRSPGPSIVIRFPDGHGLKPGDAIRHRGIDIGHVESVDLSSSLDGVEVHAVLDTSAAAIACEGTKFWIVRPRLDLTGVSGLETAVGSKYIAVTPGNSSADKYEFNGLGVAPPDGAGRDGIELILRGDQRWGVNPGSPITWRGVEVGQVLSSSLSPDALHVDTRIHISEPYRTLVRRNSKFWVISGIHMGFDVVSGFDFSTDSLASVARGGIAFITPGPDPDNEVGSVQPGDVFTLHKEKNDDWIEAATAIDLLDMHPPPVSMVMATWTQKVFGITRTRQLHASALTVGTPTDAKVYLPADLLREPQEAPDGDGSLAYRWDETEFSLDTSSWKFDATVPIAMLPLPADRVVPEAVIEPDRIRGPGEPEDCFAIRRSWHSEEESAHVIEMIGRDQLVAGDGVWTCTNTKLSRDVWHGAAVIASSDEKLIGMIVVQDDQPMLVPLPD